MCVFPNSSVKEREGMMGIVGKLFSYNSDILMFFHYGWRAPEVGGGVQGQPWIIQLFSACLLLYLYMQSAEVCFMSEAAFEMFRISILR